MLKLKQIKKARKGQEEMMGFVVIVMIIIVVGVVFLAFSLRKPSSTTSKQQELADITWALLSYTTNCSVNTMPQSVWDLAKQCNTGGVNCDDTGKPSCQALNETMTEALTRLIGTNVTLSDEFVHAYIFEFKGDGMHDGKMRIERGNLSGNYFSYLTFIPSKNGDINVTNKFYYS